LKVVLFTRREKQLSEEKYRKDRNGDENEFESKFVAGLRVRFLVCRWRKKKMSLPKLVKTSKERVKNKAFVFS